MRWQRLGWMLCALHTSACVSVHTNAVLNQAERWTDVQSRTRSTSTVQAQDNALNERELQQGITRDHLVAWVWARDPVLAGLAARVQSSVHQARAMGAVPAPDVEVQVWNVPYDRPWSFDRAQMFMVEWRQMLPALGQLDADARAGAHEAHALRGEMMERMQDLSLQVEQAWIDHTAAVGHHQVHHTHLAWIDAAREAMDARLTGGEGELADVARLESERARTLRAMARFENAERLARTTLNTLLQRASDAPLVLLEGAFHADGTHVTTLTSDEEHVLTQAEQSRGVMQRVRELTAAQGARARSARIAATVPAFSLGVSTWIDPTMTPGYGLRLGMTLPWLSVQGRERERAESWAERATEADVAATRLMLRQQIASAMVRLHAAERDWQLVATRAVPTAIQAQEAAAAAYVTGRGALLSWLDAERELLDTRLELVDAAAEVARAVSELERGVGQPLPRTLLRGEP